MVRNFILIFCLCVCFCQHHISVSLYTHLYTHIINKLLHGWFVCTIFIIHSLWRIAKLTRSLRSLVRLTILHNSWIKIVRTHQPWSNLYIAPPKSTIKFLNVKAAHLKLQYLFQIVIKFAYFNSSQWEGALLLVQKVWTSNIEYQPGYHVWNVENLPFQKPEKNDFMFLLHISITYTKQYNRTIKRRTKPMKGCLLFRVKSWFCPNMV